MYLSVDIWIVVLSDMALTFLRLNVDIVKPLNLYRFCCFLMILIDGIIGLFVVCKPGVYSFFVFFQQMILIAKKKLMITNFLALNYYLVFPFNLRFIAKYFIFCDI